MNSALSLDDYDQMCAIYYDDMPEGPARRIQQLARWRPRGRPLISALHEPHLPALQFHRTAKSPT